MADVVYSTALQIGNSGIRGFVRWVVVAGARDSCNEQMLGLN